MGDYLFDPRGNDTHPLDLADFLITISSKSGGISLIIAQ